MLVAASVLWSIAWSRCSVRTHALCTMVTPSAVAMTSYPPPKSIRIRNVPFDVAQPVVRAAIEDAFGDVEDVFLVPWGRAKQGRHRGFGSVTFLSVDAASLALERGTLELHGREVQLEQEREQQLPRKRRARVNRARQDTISTGKGIAKLSCNQREHLLSGLADSRSRDYSSAADYRLAITSVLLQVGPLESADEFAAAIGAACRARDPQTSLRLLRNVEDQCLRSGICHTLSREAFHAGISVCIGPARWRGALEVLKMMPAGSPSVVSYSLAVRACAKANQLDKAMRLLRKIEVRWEAIPMQRRDAAHKTVCTAYRAVLEATARLGRWQVACTLLERLRVRGVRPTVNIFLAALTACAQVRVATRESARVGNWRWDDPAMEGQARLKAAHDILRTMERQAVHPDIRCINAALRLCAAQRDVGSADELFHSLTRRGLRPDLLSFTSIISCCTADKERGHLRAMQLLGQMEAEDITPDVVTFGAAIAACAADGHWLEATGLLRRMISLGVEPDVPCYAACISALGRGDRCDDALHMLSDLEQHSTLRPTTIAYNAALAACERAGRWRDALELLEGMDMRSGCKPNTVSLNTAISACEKGGEWRRALALLESFTSLSEASLSFVLHLS